MCRVSTPEYWTLTGQVVFNFSGLNEDAPDRLQDYQWALGDTPYDTNVVAFTSVERTTSKFSSFNIASLVWLSILGQTQHTAIHELLLTC